MRERCEPIQGNLKGMAPADMHAHFSGPVKRMHDWRSNW